MVGLCSGFVIGVRSSHVFGVKVDQSDPSFGLHENVVSRFKIFAMSLGRQIVIDFR